MEIGKINYRNKPRYVQQQFCRRIYRLIFKNSSILGLGFRPLPPEDNVESTLIWYKGTDYENYKLWTEALTKFLAGKFFIVHKKLRKQNFI